MDISIHSFIQHILTELVMCYIYGIVPGPWFPEENKTSEIPMSPGDMEGRHVALECVLQFKW